MRYPFQIATAVCCALSLVAPFGSFAPRVASAATPRVVIADAATTPTPLALANPSFEAPYVPLSGGGSGITGSLAQGWSEGSSWADVTVAYSADAVRPHAGGLAQRVDIAAVRRGQWQMAQELPPLSPAVAPLYRVTLWLRGTPGLFVSVGLAEAQSPWSTLSDASMPLTADWQPYRVVAHVPPGLATNLLIDASSPGTVEMDDASGTVANEPVLGAPASGAMTGHAFGMHTSNSVLTTLRGGDMEGSFRRAVTQKLATTTGEIAPNWYDSSDWADVTVHYAADRATYHGGAQSQRIDVAAVRSGRAQIVQHLLLPSPASYTVTLWMRGDARQTVDAGLLRASSPWTGYGQATATMDGTWQQLRFTAVVPDPINDLQLVVGTGSTGHLWLDDVALTNADGSAPQISWPSVRYGTLRTWDSVSWASMEPQPGIYDWRTLDLLVAEAGLAHDDIILTLGQSPSWASSQPDQFSWYGLGAPAPPRTIVPWMRFVHAVAHRYRGAIHYYEAWNEPNDPTFYTGDVATLVRLTRATRALLNIVDPSAKVITPAAYSVGWLDRFLAAGGGGVGGADIVGFHIYETQPEGGARILADLRSVLADHHLALPLWTTEGGSGTTATSETEEAALLARTFLVQLGWGAQRFAWYTWGTGFDISGPTTYAGSLQPNAAARAYDVVEGWLVGTTIATASERPGGVWQIDLTTAAGTPERVLWCTSGSAEVALPVTWLATQTVDLSGAVQGLPQGSVSLRVGPAPLLLR